MLCANKRCFALLAVVTSVSYAADEAYVAEIQKWRQENDDFLCSERSPLRLVGRFQLKKVIRGWAAIPLPLSSFLIELRGRQGRSRGAVEHLVSRRPKEHRLPSMANR